MQRIKSVDFAVTGLAGSLGYRLINSTGSVTSARTNAGVIEIGSGAYFALVTIPDSWSGMLLWDDGKSPRVYAHEGIEKNLLGIGTLLNRIIGSAKQASSGTFNYSNIGLISSLGTHLQSRIQGTIGLALTLTQLGTHLNARVNGTIASQASLGTHLNTRIPGTLATKGLIGSVKGAGFFVGTHSLVQIRNSISGGSAPSYIGSAVWAKNPNNFIAADTFGQRIGKILERASSGVGGVAVSTQIFSDKEKQKLFDWIKAMTDRIGAIEVIISQLNPETKKVVSQLIVEIKTNQTKLQEDLQGYIKKDTKETENIKNDLDFIATSFEEIAKMNSDVNKIKEKLEELESEVPSLIKDLHIEKLPSALAMQSQEIKTLLSQSINIATDVSNRLSKNLITLAEDRKNASVLEKVVLSLVPTERLKEIIESNE